jgi:hypothetical protein
MPESALDQEYHDEAKRLTLLPVADQREIIALYRSVASNPKLPKHEREAGHERADALEKLLKLARKKTKNLSTTS